MIITYTGSLCGTFIAFLFPAFLVFEVRRKNYEGRYGENFNKSYFSGIGWLIFVLVFSVITLASAIYTMTLPVGSETSCPI